MIRRLVVLATLGSLAFALPSAARAQSIEVLKSSDPKLVLKTVRFEGGKTVTFTHGIGSAAFRHPNDPPRVIWTVGDRGPNFTCNEVKEVMGLDPAKICGTQRPRVYPVPEYTPSIYRVRLDATGFAIERIIPLKDGQGRPINGLTNPLTVATTEQPVDGAGRPLSQNPSAIDAEGLVRLADGSFWIGEENAPSIVHVAADGRIVKRIVPAGTEKDFPGAGYPVVGGLPAILAKRTSNRGIESLAISPDERFLYTIMQNPLANPDAQTYQAAKNTRILQIDRATETPVAEYVYQLDDPESFRLDPSKNQSAPRISEMIALDANRLIVLERTEGTTKLHEIDLAGASNILGSKWDDPATRPSLEASNDLAATGITPVRKTLRFDTADYTGMPTKMEGLAFLGDGTLAIVNDNDFAILGGETEIVLFRSTSIRGSGR